MKPENMNSDLSRTTVCYNFQHDNSNLGIPSKENDSEYVHEDVYVSVTYYVKEVYNQNIQHE